MWDFFFIIQGVWIFYSNTSSFTFILDLIGPVVTCRYLIKYYNVEE